MKGCREEKNASLRTAVVGVVARIVVFAVYYLLLAVLGVELLLLAFGCLRVLLFGWFGHVRPGGWMVAYVIVLCAFVLSLVIVAFYLLRPLFLPVLSRPERCVEVVELDCPRLFGLMRLLADRVSVRLPQHVYLSVGSSVSVRICLTPWNLLSPVRAELQIGLGAFAGMSQKEASAVLMHEFGHLRQRCCIVNAAKNVVFAVCAQLSGGNVRLDNLVVRWTGSSSFILKWFGRIAFLLVWSIRKSMRNMHQFVQVGAAKLSRLLEEDADRFACRHIGSAAFASCLCKIEFLSETAIPAYHGLLEETLQRGFSPRNYLSALEEWLGERARQGGLTICSSLPLRSVPGTRTVESRLGIGEDVASHPALSKRLELCGEQTGEIDGISDGAAADLIPPEVAAAVLSAWIAGSLDHASGRPRLVSDSAFLDYVRRVHADDIFPQTMAPFFGRRISVGGSLDETADAEAGPFSDDVRDLLAELDCAKTDQAKLESLLADPERDPNWCYRGHAIQEADLETHRQYLASLQERVRQADRRIRDFLLRNSVEPHRGRIRDEYGKLDRILAVRDRLEAQVEKDVKVIGPLLANRDVLGSRMFGKLCAALESSDRVVKTLVQELDAVERSRLSADKRWRKLLAHSTSIRRRFVRYSGDEVGQMADELLACRMWLEDFLTKCELHHLRKLALLAERVTGGIEE